MKLAEALVLRADVQKRIAQMRERLRQSGLVQEGEQPPYVGSMRFAPHINVRIKRTGTKASPASGHKGPYGTIPC